jgi:hypothetical protein
MKFKPGTHIIANEACVYYYWSTPGTHWIVLENSEHIGRIWIAPHIFINDHQPRNHEIRFESMHRMITEGPTYEDKHFLYLVHEDEFDYVKMFASDNREMLHLLLSY